MRKQIRSSRKKMKRLSLSALRLPCRLTRAPGVYLSPSTTVALFFFSLIYITCRFVLQSIPAPESPFTELYTDVSRQPLTRSSSQVCDGVERTQDCSGDNGDIENHVARAFEFADEKNNELKKKRSNQEKGVQGNNEGGGDQGGKPYVNNKSTPGEKSVAVPVSPDAVEDYTMSYPPWVHQLSVMIPLRLLLPSSDPNNTATYTPPPHPLCVQYSAMLYALGIRTGEGSRTTRGPVGSVLLDAGWWEAGDMFQPRNDLFYPYSAEPPTAANGLSLWDVLMRAKKCDGITLSSALPNIIIWTSALIPSTDRRFAVAAEKGYLLHDGEIHNHHRAQSNSSNRENIADGSNSHSNSYKKPIMFRWRREPLEGDSNNSPKPFYIEGALLDCSNPAAVNWFMLDSVDGLYPLLLKYDDVSGVRLGGVDALLRDYSSAGPGKRKLVYGSKGVYDAEDYSKDYYRLIGDGGRRAVTKINIYRRKMRERAERDSRDTVNGDGAGSQQGSIGVINPGTLITRSFVVVARSVDSRNMKDHFNTYSPTEAVSMAFVGDHTLTYSDFRSSGLNLIHSTYQCYPNIGTIPGDPWRARRLYREAIKTSTIKESNMEQPLSVYGLSVQKQRLNRLEDSVLPRLENLLLVEQKCNKYLQNISKREPPVDNSNDDQSRSERGLEAALIKQWIVMSSMMPVMYINLDEISSILPTLKSKNNTAKASSQLIDAEEIGNTNHLKKWVDYHNALTPYYAANTVRSNLYELTSLNIQTRSGAKYKHYQNAHGNPYCGVRYIPSTYHKMFRRINDSERKEQNKMKDRNETKGYDENVNNVTGISTNNKAIIQHYKRDLRVSRSDLPHVLFRAPLDDYQFAIGGDILAVPTLSAALNVSRKVSLPLPVSSPGMHLWRVYCDVQAGDMYPSSGLGIVKDNSLWLDTEGVVYRYSSDRLMRAEAGATPVAGEEPAGVFTGLTATVLPPVMLQRRGALIPLILTIIESGTHLPVLVFASDIPPFCRLALPLLISGNNTDYAATEALVSVMIPLRSSDSATDTTRAASKTHSLDYIISVIGGAWFDASVPYSFHDWIGGRMGIGAGVAVSSAPSAASFSKNIHDTPRNRGNNNITMSDQNNNNESIDGRFLIFHYVPSASSIPGDTHEPMAKRFSVHRVAGSVIVTAATINTIPCTCYSRAIAGLHEQTISFDCSMGYNINPTSKGYNINTSAAEPRKGMMAGSTLNASKLLSKPLHKRHILLPRPVSSKEASSTDDIKCSAIVASFPAQPGWLRLQIEGPSIYEWGCACRI